MGMIAHNTRCHVIVVGLHNGFLIARLYPASHFHWEYLNDLTKMLGCGYLFCVLQFLQIFGVNTFFVFKHLINLWLQPVHREKVAEYHHYHHTVCWKHSPFKDVLSGLRCKSTTAKESRLLVVSWPVNNNNNSVIHSLRTTQVPPTVKYTSSEYVCASGVKQLVCPSDLLSPKIWNSL